MLMKKTPLQKIQCQLDLVIKNNISLKIIYVGIHCISDCNGLDSL